MENRCPNYLGAVCINGSCPIANIDEYIERGYDVVRSCDDCHYYSGCEDCYWYRDNQCKIDEMLDDNEQKSDNRTWRKGSEKKMKRTTKQSTKITKNRITALILALILTATVLSPIIPVKAQETTAESAGTIENNNNGNNSNAPTIETNPDGTRTLKFTQFVLYKSEDGKFEYTYQHDFTVNGKGKFVIIGYYNSLAPDDPANFASYLLSNETFSCKDVNISNSSGTTSTSTWDLSISSYKGVYYTSLGGFSSSYKNSTIYTSGYMNEHKTNHERYLDALKADIDNGRIDLSKDDYVSEDDIANMTPVRDPSIGYLPRVRYFDDRKSSSSSHNVTATIQWDSFQEPYVSDLENPYYVEIYAKCYFEKVAQNIESNIYRYKRYGDVKYVYERCVFPDDEPCLNYLSTINVPLSDLVYGISFPHLYNYGISEYYVRLVHYDNEKQQLLCGGFTKLTLDGHGGCTSSEGDFTDDGNWENDPDSDGDKVWGADGDIKPIVPDPGNPDFTIDDSNVFTLLYSLVKSASNFISGSIILFLNAFKTVISSVGEFPALFKSLFSFLPNEIVYLMLAGVAAVIVMRFLGR